MRFQWNQVLKQSRNAVCPKESCVYNEIGYCDEPFINYGNGDAECHEMTYRQVVQMLGLHPDKTGGVTQDGSAGRGDNNRNKRCPASPSKS